ncbi:hypothetical protein V8E53_003201 [Lactarius tabidus]
MSCNMGSVWVTMGKMVINTSTDKCMAEILSCINVKDRNTIQQLSNDHKVADLELSALAITDNIPVGACITTVIDRAPEFVVDYEGILPNSKAKKLAPQTSPMFIDQNLATSTTILMCCGGGP